MRVRRLGWLVVAVALLAIGAALWWSRGEKVIRTSRITYARKLDVEAFAKQVAERLRRAKETSAAPKPASAPPRHDNKWELQGKGASRTAGKTLTQPCILGPAELCQTLGPLIDACDGGDSQDCMAVGEYLVDNPPRPLIASVFFMQACRIGDADGCERFYNPDLPDDQPCASDPYRCAVSASRSQDETRLDEACALGVADACAYMILLIGNDDERVRAYVDTACQLGNPTACQQLAISLSPDCEPESWHACYPPDEVEAKKARDIACRAGWGACD